MCERSKGATWHAHTTLRPHPSRRRQHGAMIDKPSAVLCLPAIPPDQSISTSSTIHHSRFHHTPTSRGSGCNVSSMRAAAAAVAATSTALQHSVKQLLEGATGGTAAHESCILSL